MNTITSKNQQINSTISSDISGVAELSTPVLKRVPDRRLALYAGAAGFLLLGLFLGFLVARNYNFPSKTSTKIDQPNNPQPPSASTDTSAVAAGKLLSHNQCTGTGPITLTHSPMNANDFSIFIPYGMAVGGHVTPIDHQYFSPKDFYSARDAYPVFAMADGTIVDIGSRPRQNPKNPNDKFEEYRIVFAHTCTFLTYYDLVTGLAPEIKSIYDAKKDSNGYAIVSIPVKAGQRLGAIGGQTLDFAVWDTEKPLTGFITPALYDGEAWKLYTANTYEYVTPELKQLLTERNPRLVEPIEGKIDYDQPGKLVGNWFEVGTTGYSNYSDPTGQYWKGHLAIVPDHYDPTVYRLSFGDFRGEARQFVSVDRTFNAAIVDVSAGLVKIDLVDGTYVDSSGRPWNNMSLIKGPKLRPGNSNGIACAVFQVLEGEKLDMELFYGKECSAVKGFGAQVKHYYR